MRKLGRHYRDWAGLPDKLAARQAIVDAMFAMPDRHLGLALLLAALRDDPTALADDPLLEGVTTRLTALWAEQPELYDHARDLLLTERGDKGRVVLASSLVAYLEGPGANLPDPEHQRRAHLAGDLADAYFQATDDFARERLHDGMRKIAGTDVATVLSDPLAVDVRKLSVVEGEVGAMHDRLGELSEGEAGGAYEHWLDPLRALAEFDQEELTEQVIAQP
jgi:hypothetical protein